MLSEYRNNKRLEAQVSYKLAMFSFSRQLTSTRGNVLPPLTTREHFLLLQVMKGVRQVWGERYYWHLV